MQPNDILTVSYERGIPINGTLRIAVLVHMQNTVLASSVDLVSYKNNQENEVVVSVYLYSENMQNTSVTATTALNHYETPQWELFGFGAVLSSLALVPIFKSKKQTMKYQLDSDSKTPSAVLSHVQKSLIHIATEGKLGVQTLTKYEIR